MAGNKNRYLSIIYNDFMVSILATKPNELEKGQTYQVPLKEGIVVNGLIEDDDEFYFVLKDLLKKLKIKKHFVRVVAPSGNSIMKKISVPELVTDRETLTQYVDEEINESIRLPFDDAMTDVYDENPTDGEALLFASSKDELTKIVQIIEDLGQYPEVIDVKALADLRVIEKVLPDFNELTNLVLDWSIDEVRLTIIENGQVELIRSYRLNSDFEDWQIDNEREGIVAFELVQNRERYMQEITNVVAEIDQAVHFYQFSLNKGSREIQRVINLGDHPMIDEILAMIKKEVPLQVKGITDEEVDEKFPTYYVKHSTLLGLTMKGVSYE